MQLGMQQRRVFRQSVTLNIFPLGWFSAIFIFSAITKAKWLQLLFSRSYLLPELRNTYLWKSSQVVGWHSVLIHENYSQCALAKIFIQTYRGRWEAKLQWPLFLSLQTHGTYIRFHWFKKYLLHLNCCVIKSKPDASADNITAMEEAIYVEVDWLLYFWVLKIIHFLCFDS